MHNFFSLRREGDHVVILTLCNQDNSENPLKYSALDELEECLDKLTLDSSVKGLVFASGRKEYFSIGSDLLEVVNLKGTEDARARALKMQRIFSRVANLKFPSVSAIDGS